VLFDFFAIILISLLLKIFTIHNKIFTSNKKQIAFLIGNQSDYRQPNGGAMGTPRQRRSQNARRGGALPGQANPRWGGNAAQAKPPPAAARLHDIVGGMDSIHVRTHGSVR